MDTNAMSFNWGMWTWLIILILFLFMGWNGFGWFGWNNAAAWMAGLANSNNNHDNTVDILNNNTQWQQQMFAQQNLMNQTNLISTGFCGVNQNIERAVLAWQQNTAAIIAASAANVQKVLDKMCEQETDRLRTALAEARVVAQNNAQTNELIARLSPTPTPSWIVASPYTSIYPPATATATTNS